MPTVSIVIACLNGVKTIGHAIKSAQEQTLKDIEIIVVDDGSTDGTYDYVKSLASFDPRIVPIRLPQNVGPSSARNEGFKLATGEWIAVLDADDWMDPPRLEAMLRAAQETNADAVLDNMKFYDHSLGTIVNQTHFGIPDKISQVTPIMAFKLDNPFRRSSIGYLQPAFRRRFLKQHNLAYNTTYRVGEDFLLLLEVILSGGKCVIKPNAYYVYVHMVSPSTRKKSPFSHTRGGADQIDQACDDLIQKYGSSMTAAERKALRIRQQHFKTLHLGRNMQKAFREHHLADGLSILLKRPQIFLLAAASLSKMAYARISN